MIYGTGDDMREGDMREEDDMRDVIGEMGWGMIYGTDHLPEIDPAGLPFLVPPPPIHEERETGTANDLRVEKRMLILYLTC